MTDPMTISQLTLATAFVLLLLLVIAAAYVQNRTRWYQCPRCLFWHNEQGERSRATPSHGILHSTRPCHNCLRAARYVDPNS